MHGCSKAFVSHAFIGAALSAILSVAFMMLRKPVVALHSLCSAKTTFIFSPACILESFGFVHIKTAITHQPSVTVEER